MLRSLTILSQSWVDLIKFPQPKYRFHKSVWKRITACIDHNKHYELLQALDKDMDDLERLTSGSLDLDPIRKDRGGRTKTRQIEMVRQYARSLHSSLSTRWTCQCPHPHVAHLQLENLSFDAYDKPRFRILFSYGTIGPPGQAISWKMKEIEVEPRLK